jgi:hypothetical protein
MALASWPGLYIQLLIFNNSIRIASGKKIIQIINHIFFISPFTLKLLA